VGRENILKPTVENESLHQDSNDNGVRIVNMATSKIWLLRSPCSHTETFISTPVPLLWEDSQPEGSHIGRLEMVFEYTECMKFQGSCLWY